MMIAIYVGAAFLLGSSIGIILLKMQQKQILAAAKERANTVAKDARRKSDELIKDSERKAREAVDLARRKYEQSVQQKLEETRRSEQRAKDIEKTLQDEKHAAADTKADDKK